MNVQGIATIAALAALGGLFLGVGLPVLRQPEPVAPISVVVPATDVSTDDDGGDDAGRNSPATAGEQDDDRDDQPRPAPVSGDGDDDGAADERDDRDDPDDGADGDD